MQVLILILVCAGLVWIVIAFLLRKRNSNRNFLNRNSNTSRDPIYYSTMESVDGTNHSASSVEYGGGSFGGGGSGGNWGGSDSGDSGGDSGGDGGGGGD